MLCQNCKEKPASVHFVKVVNGVKTQMHLCDKCAPLAGSAMPGIENFDITVSDILGSFFSSAASAPAARCEACGTTFDEFSRTGKLGCPNCYDAFTEQLRSPLQRIHGSARHSGKSPKRAGDGVDEVSRLKKALEASVAAENFEEAAKLRDQIKSLEGGGGQ